MNEYHSRPAIVTEMVGAQKEIHHHLIAALVDRLLTVIHLIPVIATA